MMGDDVGIDSRARFEAYCERDPTDGGPVQFDGAWRRWQAAEADALERAAALVNSADGEMLTHREVAAAIRELKL